MKVLIVIGTRPEVIKMAPVYHELKAQSQSTRLCSTGQHRELLDEPLSFFDLSPDDNLAIMDQVSSLSGQTSLMLEKLTAVMENYEPDLVLVHGDTSTALAGGLAAFYLGIRVGHVEAGLRTYDRQAPFPEEMNRQMIARLAHYHFAPTPLAKQHLLSEHIPEEKIIITGNTAIDALQWTLNKKGESDAIKKIVKALNPDKPLILVTLHRRENQGPQLQDIAEALIEIAHTQAVEIVLPLHPNPAISRPLKALLDKQKAIHLIPALPYPDFVFLMHQSRIILTDSGGIQEEAPALGIPVIVLRSTTERPEAISAGTAFLAGSDKSVIVNKVTELLTQPASYTHMAKAHHPFGNGQAAKRIVEFIANNHDGLSL